LLVAILSIDDWGRDFTTNHAEVSFDAQEPALRSFVSRRSTADLVTALQWGARRIGGWEFIGTAAEGQDTFVMFVRTSRIFRFKDDIKMRVRDKRTERVISGQSSSRFGKGDLGQNPRNLRRLMAETKDILDGANP
jgi:hypothetical protein